MATGQFVWIHTPRTTLNLQRSGFSKTLRVHVDEEYGDTTSCTLDAHMFLIKTLSKLIHVKAEASR